MEPYSKKTQGNTVMESEDYSAYKGDTDEHRVGSDSSSESDLASDDVASLQPSKCFRDNSAGQEGYR